jgi:hypothetical protein
MAEKHPDAPGDESSAEALNEFRTRHRRWVARVSDIALVL